MFERETCLNKMSVERSDVVPVSVKPHQHQTVGIEVRSNATEHGPFGVRGHISENIAGENRGIEGLDALRHEIECR